ncbi:MAG: hypothetical protein IJ552_03265 [Prevotella sp.]|nr:hypothetical protein [Prevotella sp.]
MKYRFITIIHYLKLNKPDCRIPLASGMISNKTDVLKDVLSYKNLLSLNTLGMFSIDEFEDKTFYVVDGDLGNVTKEDVDVFGTSLAYAYLRQIQWLTNEFWTLRDNSIYLRDSFLFVYEKDIEKGFTYKADLSMINSKASAKIEPTIYSKEEIEELAKDMHLILVEEVRSGGVNYRDVTQFQYFKSGKIGRKMMAWVYVFHARGINALTIKVLMYITAMEALVSTSTAELSHQVAERVAILIGTNVAERHIIYHDIKKGYNIRSKAAHGEPLKGTEQEVADLLVILDDYLRRLLRLESPYNFDDNKLNEFFIKKLMGESEPENVVSTK